MPRLIPVDEGDKVVAALRLPLAAATTILVFSAKGEVWSVKCTEGGVAVDWVLSHSKLEV